MPSDGELVKSISQSSPIVRLKQSIQSASLAKSERH